MKSKLPFLRAAFVLLAWFAAVFGYFGTSLEIIAVILFFLAYGKKAGKQLRKWLKPPNKTDDPELPLTETGRRKLAVHEAGHAVAYRKLMKHRVATKATIVPGQGTLGRVSSRQTSSDPYDFQEAISEIAVDFAGGAAEEEFGLARDAGGRSDIRHATEFARWMVCEWGFSNKLPRRSYDVESGLLTKEILTLINAEIDGFLEIGLTLARKTMKEHRAAVERVAELLLKLGTLDEKQLKEAIERTP